MIGRRARTPTRILTALVPLLIAGCAEGSNEAAEGPGQAAAGANQAAVGGNQAPEAGADTVSNPLVGTAWRLVELGGEEVVGDPEATLEFPEAGRIAGSGSCNQMGGSVEITGTSISVGQLISTRMACPEPIMDQETQYLAALEGAERFAIEDSILLVFYADGDQPLRFEKIE